MVAYADLDCSTIDELPPGRKPITTALIDNDRRQSVIERVGNACQQGRQAYWVCALIEESEALDATAAEVTAEQLTAGSAGLAHRTPAWPDLQPRKRGHHGGLRGA
jgi:ATP-dependent DNA helicase RecG